MLGYFLLARQEITLKAIILNHVHEIICVFPLTTGQTPVILLGFQIHGNPHLVPRITVPAAASVANFCGWNPKTAKNSTNLVYIFFFFFFIHGPVESLVSFFLILYYLLINLVGQFAEIQIKSKNVHTKFKKSNIKPVIDLVCKAITFYVTWVIL